jgi:uncharacterized protein YbjT (DUF2867 family)
VADVLVLGGTGTTGSRIAAELGRRAKVATRNPVGPGQVRFDWSDRSTYATVLRDTTAIYLLAPVGDPKPADRVEPFLSEARQAGVRRVVLLSGSPVSIDSPGLGDLQRLVRTMPEWTVLKPTWFMQNFTGEHLVAQGIRSGEIVTATGDGRIAFVDAGDIAAVAVRALIDNDSHDTEHLITGPAALSYADAAEIIAEHLGHPVRHRCVSTAELATRHADAGMPADYAAVLAAMDEDIRHGSEDRVTTTVERVTGRPARDFHTFVTAEVR